ncbi:MAG TPA: protein TolR, partial [Hyphomonadaceae bacterium]|nr:protein TolR [Hyphomonadaceae bacterium]
MAGKVPSSGGGGAISEPNVIPFIDILLVLLIIFMVTAPLLTAGVAVDLPKTRAKLLSQDKEPLTITIEKSGKIFLQETEIGVAELVPRLTA